MHRLFASLRTNVRGPCDSHFFSLPRCVRLFAAAFCPPPRRWAVFVPLRPAPPPLHTGVLDCGGATVVVARNCSNDLSETCGSSPAYIPSIPEYMHTFGFVRREARGCGPILLNAPRSTTHASTHTKTKKKTPLKLQTCPRAMEGLWRSRRREHRVVAREGAEPRDRRVRALAQDVVQRVRLAHRERRRVAAAAVRRDGQAAERVTRVVKVARPAQSGDLDRATRPPPPTLPTHTNKHT